jgi:hypothetical protein
MMNRWYVWLTGVTLLIVAAGALILRSADQVTQVSQALLVARNLVCRDWGWPCPAHPMTIEIDATKFRNPLGIAINQDAAYGAGKVIVNAPPQNVGRPNAADYGFFGVAGTYLLAIQYAAMEARAVEVSVNGQKIPWKALEAPTGCWEFECQKWLDQYPVTLTQGWNILRIEREHVFPHIQALRLTPVSSSGSPPASH